MHAYTHTQTNKQTNKHTHIKVKPSKQSEGTTNKFFLTKSIYFLLHSNVFTYITLQ